MWSNLENSQKWALVALVAAAASIINTLLISGDVQIVIYVIIGLGVAAFAVYMGNSDDNNKTNDDQQSDA